MSDSTNAKREKAGEFLWIVQAALLRQADDILRDDAGRGFGAAADYSGTGLFIRMDEAVRAAGLIPEDKNVADPAAEFLAFWRSDGQDAGRRKDAGWFARYGAEHPDYLAVGKIDQFRWTVQTVILADASHQQARHGHATTKDAVDALTEMIRASKVIPDDLSSTEAASDFCAFSIKGMREKDKCPRWYRT